jgi:hypothetical protein
VILSNHLLILTLFFNVYPEEQEQNSYSSGYPLETSDLLLLEKRIKNSPLGIYSSDKSSAMFSLNADKINFPI